MNNEKIVLTAKQEAYLVKHFKNTKNDVLMAKLGLKFSTFHRIVRKLGLKKTKQFMHKTQKACSDAAKASHIKNKTYPPKGYRIPRSEEFQFKPGESIKSRIGTRRWNRARKQAHDKLEQIRKEEHARATFGLPRRTRLRVVQQPRQKILDRCYLRRRGYVLDEENNIAYWTATTQRATRLEAQPRRFYRFEKHPEL